MVGFVIAGWIVQHKGEDSFIAVENRSLSLLQSFVIRTTKIFPVINIVLDEFYI